MNVESPCLQLPFSKHRASGCNGDGLGQIQLETRAGGNDFLAGRETIAPRCGIAPCACRASEEWNCRVACGGMRRALRILRVGANSTMGFIQRKAARGTQVA